MSIQLAIQSVLDGKDLDAILMQDTMREIMTGAATDAQIGGFLCALRMKGETVTEIAAAAKVMRDLATAVNVDTQNLVDTCGTGGSGSNHFNISTASAFVVAAAGGKVAKHGNRAASSKSGSADLLDAAGVNLDLTPTQVAHCIDELGVGFLFALKHHGAMKHAIGARKELKVRTIFNLLGPLSNPAAAPNQVLGVFSDEWRRPMAEVLQELGSHHVMVVHSADGLDEISIAAPTFVSELKNGSIFDYTVEPEDFGLQKNPIEPLSIEDPQQSLDMVKTALTDNNTSAADIVALNAGAAIYTANLVESLAGGVDMARDILGSGLAWERLQDFASFTQQLVHD